MLPTDAINLTDCLLVTQLLSDEAPPVSSVLHTETTLILTWRGPTERLQVEVSLERRAHWRWHNWRTGEDYEYRHDADDGWPARGKRYLMRFNRRAA